MTPDLTGLTIQLMPPALVVKLTSLLDFLWYGLVIWCGVGAALILRLLKIVK